MVLDGEKVASSSVVDAIVSIISGVDAPGLSGLAFRLCNRIRCIQVSGF